MNVLVACETSGIVRDAFYRAGCNAWSADILPADTETDRHIQCDARELLDGDWDFLIAHPPCTRLCNSGVRWLNNPPPFKTVAQMWQELQQGADLFSAFLNCDIPRKCIENPVMNPHAKSRIVNYREPEQTIQPWQFGHGEIKRTCFWLEGLDPLIPSHIVHGREARVHRMSPGKKRWKERSKFYTGVAKAMAEQWVPEEVWEFAEVGL